MPLFNQQEFSELLLPTSFTHWHDESLVEQGGQLRIDTNTAIGYGIEVYQNPSANGDTFSFKKLLAAGTYELKLITVCNNNVGRLKLEIDGVLAFDDMDLYSPSTIVNAILTRNIIIPTDGLHEFVWSINGKNASAVNYYFSGRKFWARKI
ncbi:hypothetical protein [Nostoc sp. DSM 114167]|jgi:hypothetical protein|uniref:hypothetical protein n=1 Tax=Nostoc sp. DSM 114167 TaxID=3439050 RepID=UPI0040465A4C